MNELENRQKLNEYIKAENYADALELLNSTQLSSDWCHLAIIVYLASEKESLVKQTIAWAKKNSDLRVWRRCLYEYAKMRWKMIWDHDPEGIIVLPGMIAQKGRDGISEILEVIQPVLFHIEGDESVSNELEAKILFIAINAFWLLGDIEKVRKLASYLETKTPASIELANLAMMGLIEKGSLTSDFPERLNNENPDSFNAKMLSQLLKAEIFGQSKEAFESLKAFAPEIKEEYRLRYCQGLLHIAQLLSRTEIEECIKLSNELLGKEHRFCKLVHAEYLLNSGKIDDAEEIARGCKDEQDPLWLQLYAFIRAAKEDYEEAMNYYEKASRFMTHPEVFTTLGRLATKAFERDDKYINKVIATYKSLLNLQPDNLSARHNLAFTFARSGLLQDAKEHFKYLSENSSDIIYKQNYGYCLANTDDPERALEVYDAICTVEDVPVEAVIVKTDLLKQVKDPFIAFDFLQKYCDKFWDMPLYLQCYMKVSSQANQDGLMHEAFMQLRKLQAGGKASPDIIQEKTLDDLIEHSKQWNERTRQIHDLCLTGKMPWTLADDMLNQPLYTGWLIRTQEINWVSEEPATTASYSIYATNSFHPLKSDDGKVYIKRLECPSSNSEVVMDITALITLHRLGLLDKAKGFFKIVYVPTLYLSKLFKDSDKLLFHQYSNIEAICEIKKSIDSGIIDVLDDFGTPDNRPFPYINEHTLPQKEEEHYYRLIDILDVLEKNGIVRKNELDNIKKIVLKPTGIDQKHLAIKIHDKLIIELSTLKTICNFDLYKKVLENFKIMLSSESQRKVLSEFSTIEHQKKLQDWNRKLHNILSSNDLKKIDVGLEGENRGDFSLATLMLSSQKNLPLYSDDRVLQMAALNDNSRILGFGTDVFVNALYSQGHIDLEELTNIYLQLIDWRYKFIIPPLEVMIYLAEQYSTKPPGIELKKIAMYAHECMRDPGLFCGLEKTADIPLPIAVKLYTEWFLLATKFIVKCWNNKNFDYGTLEEYTNWIVLYMLPTVPKYLPEGGYRLASITKRVVLGDVITQLMTVGDMDLGNKILLLLKQKLELSDIEYNRIVSETIDALKIEGMSEVKGFIANMAFKHKETIDLCTWAFLAKNKILNNKTPITDYKIYEILSNKEHKDRIVLKNNGPLLFFKEEDNLAIFNAKIVNLIFVSQAPFRKMVYNHFIKMQPSHEIGCNTLDKLRKIEGELISDDWIQSAITFCDIINSDWLCNLMGLQQTFERRDEQAMQEYAIDVFRPSIVSAESIGVGVLQPSYAKDSYIQDFSQIYEGVSDLCDLLDKYYYKYGHIPLCYDYSLYSMLDTFFAKHSYHNQQKWDNLWQWANTKNSPLPRYHVCCYFVRNSNNVPEGQLHKLYSELLNIIHMPVEESSELQWTSAWRLRCELAKHFGQFLESRLPGSNTERIYSQAWWMAEKIASVFGNSTEDIAAFRKYTISSEGYLSTMIWQTSRPRTQSSSLRYVTLMTSSLWSVSIISQIDNKFLDYICKADLSDKELFVRSIIGFLAGYFPLKAVDKVNSAYAYDVTCINIAEYLSQNYPDAETKEQISFFVSAVKQLSDNSHLISRINRIPENQPLDQFITAEAMRVMAYTDMIQEEDKLWENICNVDWLDKVFSAVDENVAYSIISSLIEIMLQKQDKWAWQLPHLFSIVCQKHVNNEKIKKLAFACVVISSICSDTCSALQRTLLNNKAGISELQNEWSKRLLEIYHIAPDYSKSRLRPVLLYLNL